VTPVEVDGVVKVVVCAFLFCWFCFGVEGHEKRSRVKIDTWNTYVIGRSLVMVRHDSTPVMTMYDNKSVTCWSLR
jgi:hypothetical protein